MAQAKMKFGIDLGTTNSAICKMESGEPLLMRLLISAGFPCPIDHVQAAAVVPAHEEGAGIIHAF